MINDSIDGFGVTRNTLLPRNTSNFRATLFVGAGDVHRNNVEDNGAELYALLTSTDIRTSTIDADLVYVSGSEASGDLVGFGVSAVQRIGKVNTSFRLLGSYAVDEETPFSTEGALLFSEVSYTPRYSHNLVYFTSFLALDEFAVIHERLGPLGRSLLSGSGAFGMEWVVIYGALLVPIGLLLVPFLRRLPVATRRIWMVGGTVFLAGAIGLELMTGWYGMRTPGRAPLVALLIISEEAFEMAGTLFFLYGLLDYIEKEIGSLGVLR